MVDLFQRPALTDELFTTCQNKICMTYKSCHKSRVRRTSKYFSFGYEFINEKQTHGGFPIFQFRISNRISKEQTIHCFHDIQKIRDSITTSLNLQLNQNLDVGHCEHPGVQVLQSPSPLCPTSAQTQLTAAAVWSE